VIPRSAGPRTLPTLVAGFGSVARAYERSRPEYPREAIGHLRRQLALGRGTTVVDLAAGTGKLTRGLLSTGAAVVAVEPTAGMRRVFRQVLPGLPVFDGTAEAIPVPDRFADAVTVAQAFHWFDARPALREIARVLRSGGGLALVWNVRDESVGWVRELSELLRPLRRGVPGYRESRWRAAFTGEGSFTPLQHRQFRHSQRLPPAVVIDRVQSISFVAVAPRIVRDRLLRDVQALLERDPVTRGRSVIEFPYRTDVYWCFRSR
jgi:SAM-dependent methyltransferase